MCYCVYPATVIFMKMRVTMRWDKRGDKFNSTEREHICGAWYGCVAKQIKSLQKP